MNRGQAIEYIRGISFQIGTMGIEYLSDKDGQKMRECLNLLCDDIDYLENIIDEKLGDWTKEKRHGLSFMDLMNVLDKADKYDKVKEWLQTEINFSQKRKILTYGNCFDGVPVGNENRIKLIESHIKFCENILKQME